MGFLSKTYGRFRDLYIRDGVLIKCNVDNRNIEIPDKVEAVFENAFKDCENVKLDRSPKYILDWLTDTIYYEMEDAEADFSESDELPKDYFGDTFYHLLKLWRFDAQVIEEAIGTAREKIKSNQFGIEWGLKVIDADEIPNIDAEMGKIGREKLISIDGNGSVSTFDNMPFIKYSAIQMGGDPYKKENKQLIEKEGYGILFIKNLNKENVDTLPHNFIYNLIKTHIFSNVRLSPKWMVILQIGEGVRLDAPSDFGISFNFNNGGFKNISIEEYLKDMKRDDRLVTQNMLWDAYFKLNQDKDKEQAK